MAQTRGRESRKGLTPAKQMVRVLEQAAASDAGHQDHAWKDLQHLYARFDQASQLLKDMRPTVDAALEVPARK